MAELLVLDPVAYVGSVAVVDNTRMVVNLFCWPCKTVHEFVLADVERIVYALGAEVVDAYRIADYVGMTIPDCLLAVRRNANDSEVYAEHVEQGIECRERTDG